ncbi:MAG: SRPBCC family protein [Angustibacter sp.]
MRALQGRLPVLSMSAIGPRLVHVDREIAASATAVFDVLADPSQHAALDGSAPGVGVGQVRSVARGPDRLFHGAQFTMRMRLGLPYVMANRVVEFEEGRRIAWQHLTHAVWRYELEPLGPERTRVTETFDATRSWAAPIYLRLDVPRRNEAGIRRTLERLAAIVEPAGGPGGTSPAAADASGGGNQITG